MVCGESFFALPTPFFLGSAADVAERPNLTAIRQLTTGRWAGRRLPVSVRETHSHEALLHLEEQITAALTPETQRITVGGRVGSSKKSI
jgi:hypothetical protein